MSEIMPTTVNHAVIHLMMNIEEMLPSIIKVKSLLLTDILRL
jgi:hypothetical protein